MKTKLRFSYVQLLILGVMLGLAAKIAGPKFAEASTEKKVSMLAGSVQVMRAQLDLYRVQHEDQLPPSDSFGSFEAAMTTKAKDCGPYVERVPENPFNGLNKVRFDGVPAGSGRAGWRLDTKSGLFQADNAPAYVNL